MIQITIISGKGGTGKTTIAAAFNDLAKEHTIADCDVDASNLHLILNPTINETKKFSGIRIPVINKALCIKCGKCVESCPEDAIIQENVNAFPMVKQIFCEGCGICNYECPENAIKMVPRISGEVYSGYSKEIPFINATLYAGEEVSGKLVSAVRDKAITVTDDNNKNMIIIDGSPGIGCPVIASITGVNYIIAVSEPTLSGLSDLKRVVELADFFKTKIGVIINKADLNSEIKQEIIDYTKESNVDYLGDLPFSEEVVKAMFQSKSIYSFDPNSVIALKIEEIWNRLIDIIKQ